MLTNLQEIIEKSVAYNEESQEFDCKITLKENGKTFKAYTVSIANCDLLFYTDKGCLNYLIDSIGSKHYCNLFSIED